MERKLSLESRDYALGAFFFLVNYFNWRLVTLQYCGGFCHTLTWISHGCPCVPHPETPSHLPPRPIPQGCPSAPALSALFHASNLDWWSISHTVIYMFQFYSLKSSHPCLLPESKSLFFISVSLENSITEEPGGLQSMELQRVRQNWPHTQCSMFFFKLSCFYCCWVIWALCLFWKLSHCWSYRLQMFSPVLQIVFSLCWWFPLLCRCMEQRTQSQCTGTTQKDGLGCEVGGRFGMGDTCTPVDDSCQCMAKPTTIL